MKIKIIFNSCVRSSFSVFFSSVIVIYSFKVQAGDFQFDIGGSYENFAYAEELTPPAKSTETAGVLNAIVGFRYLFNYENWMELHGAGSRGVRSIYDGSDLNTNAAVTSVNPLGFTNYEFIWHIPLGSIFSFHFGYGHRIWDRFLAGNPGYREVYSWDYTPIGLDFTLHRTPSTRLWLELSGRPTKSGKIKVITSETVTNGVDSEMDLGSKTGYRLALPFQWKLSSFWGLEITPFYEHSEIGQSNVVANSTLAPTAGTGIYEPASLTNRAGTDFLLILNF